MDGDGLGMVVAKRVAAGDDDDDDDGLRPRCRGDHSWRARRSASGTKPRWIEHWEFLQRSRLVFHITTGAVTSFFLP
jgi:hypothetical protein